MKIQFVTLFFLLFFNSLFVSAQNQHYLEGRTELCVGECENYNIVGANSNLYIEYINVTYNNQPDTTCSRLSFDEKNQTISICYFCAGTYKIEALFFGQNGQTYFDSLYVYVGYPTELIIVPSDSIVCENTPEADCDNVCSGSTRKYKTLTPDGSLVFWTVTGASYFSSTGNELTVVWGSGNNGTITASNEPNLPCNTTGFYCVNIKEAIKPTFVLPKKEICVNETIQLVPDYLLGRIYKWDFGNGEQSFDIKPDLTYDQPGKYTISLEVVDECGCTGRYFSEIIVKERFLPKIDCKSTICENTSVTYQTDADCGRFFWKVSGNGLITGGGGNSDNFISIDWKNGPLGVVELEVLDCNFDLCPQKAIFEIPIISDKALIQGKTIVCPFSREVYSIQKFGATNYNWVVQGGNITSGQGSNTIIIEWMDEAASHIYVDYENCYLKCGGSSSQQVNIKPKYHLTTTSNDVCSGDLVNIQANSTTNNPVVIENWAIKDKDNNTLFQENNTTNIAYLIPEGLDKIIVTGASQSYCNSPLQIELTILPKTKIPKGILGEKNICQNTDYLYKADSDLKFGLYTWTIKDGNTVSIFTGKEIIVQWKSDGPYILELVQRELDGNFCASNSTTLALNKIQSIDLTTQSEGCLYDGHIIKATSYQEMKYQWSINPSDAGTIVRNENNELELVWSKTGKHTIELNTCAGNFEVMVEVLPLPQPVVNFPPLLCENELVSVSTTSNYEAYSWQNEQGNNISAKPAPDVYAGTYVLEVTDIKGCKGKNNFTIDLLPIPNIHLSTPDETEVCLANGNVTFPLLYGLDAEDGYSFKWFKNGSLLPATSTTYLTNDVGEYQVEITDSYGCSNLSNPVSVFDICDINNPPVLDTFGTIKPCLTPGVTNFDHTNLDCNSIRFTNQSSGQTGNDDRWHFEDNGPTDYTIPNQPIHHFSNAGFYKVGLISGYNDVNNPGQLCYKWIRKVIEIPLKASFDYNNGCAGASLQFYDRSTFIPGKDIVTWSWDFGDPTSGSTNTSSLPDPVHIYSTHGQYLVTLTISNGTCTDVISQVITLHKKPTTTLSFPDGICEKESTIIFPDSLSTSFFNIDWEFGDVTSGANNIQNGLTAYHTFDVEGTYQITVQIESVYGCKNSLTYPVNIVKNTLNGQIISSAGQTFCEGITSTLSTSTTGKRWKWNNNLTSSSILIDKAGVYSVSVTNEFGCTYKPDPLTIFVNPAPLSVIGSKIYDDNEERISFDSPASFCVGKNLKLFASSGSSATFTWSTGQQGQEIEYSANLNNLPVAGNYQFGLLTTDINTGCTSSSNPFEVVVNRFDGTVNIVTGSTGILCEGQEHQLDIVNPISSIDYEWNTNKKTTSILVNKAGKFYVTAQDVNGCVAQSNIIEILSGPDPDLIPSGCFEKCGNDTLCFPPINGVTAYQWFKGGISISTNDGGNQPYIILSESNTYHLQMTGINGCTSNSQPLTLNFKSMSGTIKGYIYSDVNANNIIDSQDTLVSNIKVNIPGYSSVSDDNGQFIFPNIPGGKYFPTIDQTTLTDGSKILIDSLLAQLKTCDDSIHLNYLIGFDCVPKTAKINLRVCYGKKLELNDISFTKDTIINILQTNSLGCIDTSQYKIEFTKEIKFNLETVPSCPGAADGKIIVRADNSNYQFSLVNNTGTILNNEFKNLRSDSYKIKATDAFGCLVEKTVLVDEKPELQFTLKHSNISCITGLATIQIDSSNYDLDKLNITWTGGFTGDKIQVTKPGPYTLTVYNGCETVDKSVNITGFNYQHTYKKFIVCTGNKFELLGKYYSKDTILYTTLINNEGCIDTTTYDLRFGEKVSHTLDVTGHCPGQNDGEIAISNANVGGRTYLLNGQMVTTSNGTISNLGGGNYVLQIKNELGCEQKFDIVIEERSAVDYNILTEDISCFKGYAAIKIVLQNYDEESVSIKWSNGTTGVQTNVTNAGTISVDISNGCNTQSEIINIKNTQNEPSFRLPHLFNPQFDGLHSFVKPEWADLETADVKAISIFDRTGRMVYTSKDLNSNQAAQLPDGLYYYSLYFEIDICGQLKELRRSGTFTIMK